MSYDYWTVSHWSANQVSGTFADGFRTISVCPVVGPRAEEKARKTADAILTRLLSSLVTPRHVAMAPPSPPSLSLSLSLAPSLPQDQSHVQAPWP